MFSFPYLFLDLIFLRFSRTASNSFAIAMFLHVVNNRSNAGVEQKKKKTNQKPKKKTTTQKKLMTFICYIQPQ